MGYVVIPETAGTQNFETLQHKVHILAIVSP